MDENARIRETRAATQAERILENEAFTGAVEKIKDRIWKQFSSVPAEALPGLQMELKLLDELVKQLRYTVETGKLSQIHLNEIHDRQRA